MKKILFLILCAVLPSIVFSQLLPFSVFRENLSTTNPAVIDLEYLQYKLKSNGALTYQDQWLGFDENEKQFTFSGFVDLMPRKSNFIWGLNMNYDQAAAFQTFSSSMRGALKVPVFSKYHYFSVGIDLGGVFTFLRLNKVNVSSDVDPLLQGDGNLRRFSPKAGVGVYYYYYKDGQNSYFAGLSLPNVVPLDFVFDKSLNNTSTVNSSFSYSILQHISLQGGYRFNLGRDYFDVSGWMKKAVTGNNVAEFPTRWNVTAKYHFKSIFWVAGGATVSLKNKSALSSKLVTGSFGFDIPSQRKGLLMQFGVSYSLDMGVLASVTNGTPELYFRMARF